ncbi:hypothetical protein CFC21_044040 [Triticum aestivum]|uniref:Uncharacterized protein n=2 Tax=Triticum aestivum TaxID=4565 RepID=A0A3B6FWP4_WHEAT|nr:ATP-citrate synthase beta chain protein 1-like [Triticum aestivum]KAF7032909.1 hypothetical protein CFC21_044040 [Triticum aestivum]
MEAERSAVEGIQVPERRKKVVNATHQQSSSHARHAHVLLLLIPHHGAHKLFEVKMTVVLGELGGSDEYSLLESLKQGKVEKPVVAWGAVSGGELESTQAKNQALRDAGAVVPTSFEALERIKDFRSWLRKEKFLLSLRLHLPPFLKILKLPLKVGRSELLQFISTISEDRG